MKQEDFVHLHCHSTYSLLEALPSPREIIERARELGTQSVGLADNGYVHGLIEFFKEANSAGIKPILGLETYIAARTRHDKDPGIDTRRYPLVLLAETKEGYENLLQIASAAALEGMYYRPRADHELLEQYGKGLIALTGPISGAIPQAALAEDGNRIMELVDLYRSFFGKNNLYFELMDLPNVTGQAEVNQQLIQWGEKLHVPLVVTCNSHYCRPEDVEAHDVLLCIQKNALVSDPNRFSMRDSDFSMRQFSDLERVFSHVSEALENTKIISDRCNVSLTFDAYRLPRFPTPKGVSEPQHLREICHEGLKRRFKTPSSDEKERLEHELRIIEQMGFSGYFLIVADFVNEAKRRGITVGPGRGSAAGSMVSYCLNITTINPLEHGLIFERFLNPERISMPDIDMDFADVRRDDILAYVREKYGEDRVVQICTFGTLAARAAVKDVGRAYGVPFMEMNTLAKLIPAHPGTTLASALKTPELKMAYESSDAYRRIIDAALKLEGKARHVSIHACGIIITPGPAVEYTALQRAPKDEHVIITQYAVKPIETLGLLKMDLLGLTNLTVIQTTLEIIKRTQKKEVDMDTIPLNDKRTFRLLQRGETTGVFQFESPGMRRYLQSLKPTTFRDITAMTALYRPGPMEWIPQFIQRRHGKESVSYLHPNLKDIFEETYGIGVYQEQILKLARVFAGYSLGEADLLRRAIGKKIKKELDAQHEKFVNGAVKNGYKKQLAEKIFDEVILPFAGYGFPKAHSVGYARIAYETAYLKTHYPVEFMAALLSSDAQRTDRIMIEIDECRSMGINVLPPNINESLRHFTALPKERSIRFGLSAIKGMGESSVHHIIGEREQHGEFKTIEDFARRVLLKILNKKTLEALAKSGALDVFGERRMLVENYDRIAEYRKACGEMQDGQRDLFFQVEDRIDEALIEFPMTVPALSQQRLQWEKETLGLYISSHPLSGLKKYIGKKAQLVGNLSMEDVGRKVTLAGIIEEIRHIKTKRGDTMAIVSLEDPTGKIEVALFPRIYATVQEFLNQSDTVLVVGGTIDSRGAALQLRADVVKRASLASMIANAKKEGFFDEDEAKNAFPHARHDETDNVEEVEIVDDEGNIVAGETVTIGKKEEEKDFLGPIAKWIVDGMAVDDVLGALDLQKETGDMLPTKISVHTVTLPLRAPKQLLLELKSVFRKFPGREKVQLRIGETVLPLSLTISMSTILEKKIAETVEKYTVAA